MGFDKNRRPVKAHSINTFSSGVTSTGPLVVTGTGSIAGLLTLSGGLRYGVEAGTTSANLVGYGVSTLTTSTGPKNYTLSGPTGAGVLKILACIDDGSSESAVVFLAGTTASGASFYTSGSTSNDTRKATFNAGNEALTLLSLSTTKWMVVSNTNAVALATT
jgi:hypothetical protein